jgi:hypothetical protein
MKVCVFSVIAELVSVATSVATNQFIHLGRLVPPFEEADEFPVASASDVNVTGSSFFTQLLDHDDPSKGTFQQKFWWNAEYWAGPGSPVVFFTPVILLDSTCHLAPANNVHKVKFPLRIMAHT